MFGASARANRLQDRRSCFEDTWDGTLLPWLCTGPYTQEVHLDGDGVIHETKSVFGKNKMPIRASMLSIAMQEGEWACCGKWRCWWLVMKIGFNFEAAVASQDELYPPPIALGGARLRSQFVMALCAIGRRTFVWRGRTRTAV